MGVGNIREGFATYIVRDQFDASEPPSTCPRAMDGKGRGLFAKNCGASPAPRN